MSGFEIELKTIGNGVVKQSDIGFQTSHSNYSTAKRSTPTTESQGGTPAKALLNELFVMWLVQEWYKYVFNHSVG